MTPVASWVNMSSSRLERNHAGWPAELRFNFQMVIVLAIRNAAEDAEPAAQVRQIHPGRHRVVRPDVCVGDAQFFAALPGAAVYRPVAGMCRVHSPFPRIDPPIAESVIEIVRIQDRAIHAGVELFLRDCREGRLSGTPPLQPGRGRACIVVELHRHVVALARRQRDRGRCVVLSGMIGPVVDDLRAIDPQADAVVRISAEHVRPGFDGLDHAGPAHGEVIGADALDRRPRPSEIDVRIRSRDRGPSQILIGKVRRRQAVLSGTGTRRRRCDIGIGR